MTPELEAVWNELLDRASHAPFAERARLLREAFATRCGRFEGDHPAAGPRESASWEDALVRGGLAAAIAPALTDPAERSMATTLERAQRGVFVFYEHDSWLVARDLWAGGELIVLSRDAIGREVKAAMARGDHGICQARLLALDEGCAILPGTVFHPEDARQPIEQALAVARDERLSTDEALDALLRMEHTFRTMSRAKISYAYRPDALRH